MYQNVSSHEQMEAATDSLLNAWYEVRRFGQRDWR